MNPVKPAGHAGSEAEEMAKRFLENQGLSLIQRNYRCKMGEIDLIMQDNDTLVFVEVRHRSRIGFGSAAESITKTKRRRIVTAATMFLQSIPAKNQPPCRFDVMAITGNKMQQFDWIKDAFQVC